MSYLKLTICRTSSVSHVLSMMVYPAASAWAPPVSLSRARRPRLQRRLLSGLGWNQRQSHRTRVCSSSRSLFAAWHRASQGSKVIWRSQLFFPRCGFIFQFCFCRTPSLYIVQYSDRSHKMCQNTAILTPPEVPSGCHRAALSPDNAVPQAGDQIRPALKGATESRAKGSPQGPGRRPGR